MPRDNVDVVREYVESLSEASPGDVPRLVARFCDPQSDYYPVQKFPESRPCHGLEDIAHFVSEFLRAWDEFEYTIEAVTPVADDRVLVRARLAGLAAERSRIPCGGPPDPGRGTHGARPRRLDPL